MTRALQDLAFSEYLLGYVIRPFSSITFGESAFKEA